MSEHEAGIARKAKILSFLLKYRGAGVFGGLKDDAATAETPPPDTEGKPAQFVDDLEAMGPAPGRAPPAPRGSRRCGRASDRC